MKTPIKHSRTARSRPSRASFLEVFILDKHRGRLKQEWSNLNRRLNEIEGELEALERELKTKRQMLAVDMDQMGDGGASSFQEARNVRTMSITY